MTTIEKLKEIQSTTPSGWREKAIWRKENRNWLKKSGKIAVAVLKAIDDIPGMNQKVLAEKLNVTQQYVCKLLKGNENLTLKTIAGLEDALGISLISIHTGNEQLEPSNVFQFDFAKAVKSDSKLNNDNMCYTEDNNEAA